jgi:hypothetical protein
MAGDNECATGSPSRAKTRVLPPITGPLTLQAFDYPVEQFAQFSKGLPIAFDIASERIAHLGGGSGATGVFTEQETLGTTA